jgi:hypothetical protein
MKFKIKEEPKDLYENVFLLIPKSFRGYKYWLCWATLKYTWIGFRYTRLGTMVAVGKKAKTFNANFSNPPENIILKVITFNYTQDEISISKVVGVFEPKELPKAILEIKEFHKGLGSNIVKESSSSLDNYHWEYDDENSSYYYTSNYSLNELNL